MERNTDRSWGLLGLLLAAASLPTLLTLLAVLLLHGGAQERMRHELEERATLVAGALAEASEYGLISGNAAALDRSVRELLAHDRSIAAIDILDAARRPFVSLPGQPVANGLPTIELPVRSSVPDIDFFDRATPHVSLAEDLQPTFRLGPVAGYVRVTMTTEALQRAQQQRLGLELGVVAVAGLVGLLVVALLARRMRASLLALLDALQAMRRGRYAVAEGPVVGGELRRLQGAVLDLAETLGAAPHPTREGTPWQGLGETRGGMARRLMGRLDAALVAVRLAAMQVARQADAAGSAVDPQASAQTAARILALADQAQAAGEALVEPLRPQIVDALGLDAALAELLQACARAQPSCAFSLHLDPGFACADAAQAAEIHRAVQGALALVVANAQASQASARLQALAASSEVRVVVSDNGASEASNGAAAVRLARLRESLAARGARIDVQQASTGGTTVVVTVPATASPSVNA